MNKVVLVTLEPMKKALAEARINLACGKKWMATAMNRSCRFEEFQVGNKVVLLTKNIKHFCSHLAAKLKAQWVGLFVITQKSRHLAQC